MRREHRHHRRSRKFRSVNEYSLYRNRIYLLNTLRAAQQNRTVRKELLEWFRRNEDELEIMDAFLMQEYNKTIKEQSPRLFMTESLSSEDPAQRKAAETQFINASVKILDEKTRKAPSPGPIQTAAHLVVQRFSLKPMAGALLQLTYYYHIYHSTAHSLWDQLQDVAQGHIETTAILLGCSPEEVEDAFRELADVGIADRENLSDKRTDPGDYIHIYFERIWHPPVRDMDELIARLIDQPCEATLDLKDFAHLDNRDNAVRLLSAAIQERHKEKPATGVNILLYGRAGTGKTEFARTLCGEVGAQLYAIGEDEIGPDARPSADRSKTLDYALEALSGEPNAAILFDEMEDFHQPKKLYLNRIVEENPIPIIWACNAISYYRTFEPFFIDRMLHAIEFRHMPTRARENVYSSILREVRIPDTETRQLSQELAHNNKITPRQVALAAKQANLVSGNAQTIRRNIAQKEKLRHGTRPPDMRPIEHYDPALVHADINLEALSEQMVALGTRRFSLCLCGPPGTGKTAFVRYIAEQMGIDILPKRASDLLNKYVGENEQNIASAFAEALQTSAFLVFDEVDSLLMDRQSAQRSWEVSMVNELLSQMERHPLPFACTTNQWDIIDPAAARRFVFRAEFYFLDQPRINRAFELFFNHRAPSSALALTKLTPADFANVRDRAEILGFLNDPERIAYALAEACRIKPGGVSLGF